MVENGNMGAIIKKEPVDLRKRFYKKIEKHKKKSQKKKRVVWRWWQWWRMWSGTGKGRWRRMIDGYGKGGDCEGDD